MRRNFSTVIKYLIIKNIHLLKMNTNTHGIQSIEQMFFEEAMHSYSKSLQLGCKAVTLRGRYIEGIHYLCNGEVQIFHHLSDGFTFLFQSLF